MQPQKKALALIRGFSRRQTCNTVYGRIWECVPAYWEQRCHVYIVTRVFGLVKAVLALLVYFVYTLDFHMFFFSPDVLHLISLLF